MKRILYVSAVAMFLLLTGMALAQDQDLGAAARQQRAQKKPTAKKVYTNDDIASAPQPAAPAATADAKADAKTDAKVDKPKGTSADDKAKAAAEMQAKVDA